MVRVLEYTVRESLWLPTVAVTVVLQRYLPALKVLLLLWTHSLVLEKDFELVVPLTVDQLPVEEEYFCKRMVKVPLPTPTKEQSPPYAVLEILEPTVLKT